MDAYLTTLSHFNHSEYADYLPNFFKRSLYNCLAEFGTRKGWLIHPIVHCLPLGLALKRSHVIEHFSAQDWSRLELDLQPSSENFVIKCPLTNEPSVTLPVEI
ncbi:hypothetical protein BDQ17DRAFT_1342491 [Cyathus striatus]|nr:hypothetical protein BDQ17DRAFT_1342491 [Cyathus striatus]